MSRSRFTEKRTVSVCRNTEPAFRARSQGSGRQCPCRICRDPRRILAGQRRAELLHISLAALLVHNRYAGLESGEQSSEK